MEYNEKVKAIGVVDKELTKDSARIKIIATREKDKIKSLTEKEQKELFPPKGFVFGASFFKEYPQFKVKDLLNLECESNDVVCEDDGKDKYIISRNSAKHYSVHSFPLEDLNPENDFIDLEKLSIKFEGFEGHFYAYSKTHIIGKLQIKNGKIEPAMRKRVYLWDKKDCNLIDYGDLIYLLKEPHENKANPLDSMDDKQLFEWLRKKIKAVNYEYRIKELNKAQWKDLSKLIKYSDKDDCILSKTRLKRLEEKFKYFNLSISDIKSWIENSENLKKAFNQAIESHKEELRTEYRKDVEKYKTECEEKKQLIDKQIEEKKQELKDLQEKIVNAKTEIEYNAERKERILSDFAIIKEVLGTNNSASQINTEQREESFVIEVVKRQKNSPLITEREHFLTRLKFQLKNYSLNTAFASKFINIACIYKFIFIEDIAFGVAFAEAVGDTKYIIQQVEPDWLHFRDFWKNGLEAIWKSAVNNPELLHFLLLEDINLSSPECFARPLLDVISGVRKNIPFGKTPYPENLRILATKASTENPEIGLQLYKQTFKNCGVIGFKGSIYKTTNEPFENINGYVTPELLQSFKPEDFEIKNIQADTRDNYNTLFDEE